MKKIYLLFVAATLAACSAEPIESEALDSLNAAISGKDKAKVQDLGESFDVPELVCAGEEATFTFNFTDRRGNTTLKIQLFGDNPETEEIEEWYNIFNEQFAGGGPEFFSYTFEEAGDYKIRYQIGGGGFTEVPVSVENCGCEESFTYVANEDDTFTFTYIPEEDMDNAVLTFTFPQAATMEGLEGWTHNGNGNAQTFKTGINLTACTTYAWTVSLDAECNPSGKAILWTDFKVGEDSKKEDFELENIVKYCN